MYKLFSPLFPGPGDKALQPVCLSRLLHPVIDTWNIRQRGVLEDKSRTNNHAFKLANGRSSENLDRYFEFRKNSIWA